MRKRHGTSSGPIKNHVLIVRSPFKRLESFYKDKVVTQSWHGGLQDSQNKLLNYFRIERFEAGLVDFEAFIIDGVGKGYIDAHLTPLSEVSPRDCDFVIDIDQPDEISLLKTMLSEGVLLPHLNRTYTKNFAWTAEMIGVVHELYRKDIERYGFEPPSPHDVRDGVLEDLETITVCQDPVERFKKMFMHRAPDGDGGRHPASLPPVVDDWLDWIEEEFQKPVREQDEHIRRQSDCYRAEDVDGIVASNPLTEGFDSKGCGESAHERVPAIPLELTPAQTARIRRIYWQDYLRLGSLMPAWQERPLVAGLWIGDELPPLARLCILSFLHHGFRFKLHTYGEVAGIPEGAETADANALLAASELYLHHTGSLAPTADRIRYRYLARNGGFWADLDVACLDPGRFPEELPWFAMENEKWAAVGALGFPAGHPVMTDLERLAADPANPMAWDDEPTLERKRQWRERSPAVLQRKKEADWIALGPGGFTDAVRHHGLLERAAPPATIYPIPWQHWQRFYNGSLTLDSPELAGAWAVHLWGDMLRNSPDSLRTMESDSVVADLMHLHGCAPENLGKHMRNPGPPPRILIAVCSCAAHEEKRAAVRATWASQSPSGITVRFFTGGDAPPDGADVIGLPVDDSYPYLPSKVMAFFRHALEHFDFDWLFKCDDDTYVDLTRLAKLTGAGIDLIGNEFLASRGSPSGGAGYFLSRIMVESLVAEADIPQTGDEDVLIREAAIRLGAVTRATNRLVYDHSRFPRVENAVVSSHGCGSDRMRAIHTIRFSTPVGEIPVCHPQWKDQIQLFEDGTFIRKSTDCAGIYQENDGSFLLRWFDWGAESFELADDGTLYPTKMPQQEPPWFGNEAVKAVSQKDVIGTRSDFPLISCVMPTYGRPDYVNEAIQMFLDQDYPNKELVILNDCAGQIFTCDLPPEAGVRVINHPERFPSLGDKRNACIELAQGEFIAIWDDDDVYLPWRLSHSYRMMTAHGTPFYLAEEFYEYRGVGEPLHEKQCGPGQACRPNTLFTKRLWQAVHGYPSINVGEDSEFFRRVKRFLGQDNIAYPIKRDSRFFILRAKSNYPHMSMQGGSGQLDTRGGQFELQPKPIADPALQSLSQTLILLHHQYASTSKSSFDPAEPVISVCVSLKNRSAVPYGDEVLRLFPNTVRSLVQAAKSIHGVVELVVADFGSDDDPPGDWIHELAEGISVKLLPIDGGFSRGRGLNEAVRHSRSKRLLLTDADVLISETALQGAIDLIDQDQAWFPIFHCFNENGQPSHWLDLGYGIVGLAREVFDATGGVPEFESWGGEDDIFSNRVQIQIPAVRERCGGLRHQWHPDRCRHENYRNAIKQDFTAYVSSPAFENSLSPDEPAVGQRKFQTFMGEHPSWTGPVHLYENGRFVRPGIDSGIYEIDEGKSITLRWDRWPAEQLLWSAADGTYRCAHNRFTLWHQG